MSADKRPPATGNRTWSVGELAAVTGLTVRALHHYDEVGLLVPTLRTSAGHRRYTPSDVRRLHRVTALRGFGFSLAQIRLLLDDADLDVRELVRRQLDQAEDRVARAQRLRTSLLGVLDALDDAAAEPSASVLVQLIEVMTAVEHTYTPEELERMAEHRRRMAAQLSPQQLAEMVERRRALRDQLTPEQIIEMQRRRHGRVSAGGDS
ncbi:MerR family transcriptional regulator [Micromonospora costi]|uniref:MerR family transcriptional regulator n=1 Tax=Micromonospora costi TaxID=1530042 RepID=A0A3A9ZPP7_9ACTN|nr:MerR family transcriptional regulator [Micromonospora costi]RKN50192.1 MerR family transcriptional regulator [Micromonospora costi]